MLVAKFVQRMVLYLTSERHEIFQIFGRFQIFFNFNIIISEIIGFHLKVTKSCSFVLGV